MRYSLQGTCPCPAAITDLDGWPGLARQSSCKQAGNSNSKVDFTIVKIHKWKVIYIDLFHSSSCWFHRSAKYYNKKAGMIKSSFVIYAFKVQTIEEGSLTVQRL